MQHLELLSPIGFDQDNDPDDISSAATALVALGRWGALEAARSGQHDDALDSEIRSYQTDNGLEPDGILLPGGPTQTTLNQSLAASPLGPSLLESPRASEPAKLKGSAFPQPRNSASGRLSSEHVGRLDHVAVPKQPFRASGADDLPRISEHTRRTMEEAARMQAADQRGSPSLLDVEQIMIENGYKYVPDRMGRLGEGDWTDLMGHRVDAAEAARMARDALETDVVQRPRPMRVDRLAAAARDVRRDVANTDYPLWHDLAARLNSASRRVAAGERGLRLRLPTSDGDVETTDRDIVRVNAAIREAVVANALRFHTTTPNEVASVVTRAIHDRRVGPQSSRSRIHDMLLAAADTAASREAALHARGLLAVYQMEMDEAALRGERDPSKSADRAITHFIADQSGQVSWSVYRPDEEDDVEVSEASDDPNNSGGKKPRGMDNPNSREALKDGYRRHEQQLRPYVEQKGPGWRYGEGVKDPKTGTYVFPDVTTPRNRTMDMKPNTPTGRAAGAKQIERYKRATGERSRVFTYREFTTPPRPPNAADEKGGFRWAPSSPHSETGTVGASGRAPAAARPISPPRIYGIGGGKLYPKVDKPFYLHRMWEMLE